MFEMFLYFFAVYGFLCTILLIWESFCCDKHDYSTYIIVPFKNDEEIIEGKVMELINDKIKNPRIFALNLGCSDSSGEILSTLSNQYSCISVTDDFNSILEDIKNYGENNRNS